MADIDLAAFTGTSFNIIRGFTGVFDGNGHTIANFSYTSTNTLKIGLFALVSGANAEVKNLGLIHAEVDGGNSNSVGSLVGHLVYGTITNCYVEGGSVAGARSVGGLVGYSYKGSITNCYSNGNVSGADDVGGLVGGNAYGSVSNCYSTGDVSGDSFVGGLVGRNAAIVSNCYSTSDVNGVDYVGGLVGHNGWIGLDIPGYIFNCYSTGWIRGDSNVGGLVGYNKLGDIDRSFWDIETSGHTDSDGGTGLPTAEMQTVETFFEWVCDHAWTIDEGKDYPRLWWENALGEPLSPFSGGSGTQAEPYLIYTAEQMNSIGLFPCFFDKHFKLMADIDLSRVTGTSYNIIGNKNYPFRGVFDGNNHTISNFNRVLFGYVSGEIKDLGLIDPNIYSGNCSLVGNFWHGTITNCYVEGGRISGGNYVGSLVGRNHNGSITNCYSTANISGDRYVGGLVGWNHSTITNCYSTSSVSGYHYVGGLVGYNNYGTITNCYSDGSVSGNTDIGGLIGTNLSRVAAFKSIPFNLRYVSGTCLSLDDDEVSSAIPIPFAFNFYGTDISQLYISSNGFVTFLPGQDDGCCSGQALPDPDSPNGLIAGFWADLSPYDGGDICYQLLGTSGSREFVVGFYDVPHCCEADNNPVTFEIILHEGTNDIELQYGSAPSEGETHSVGIENFDGTDGLQIAFGDVSLINKGFLITAEVNIVGGISDSYSTATVTGNDDVGGLVGWNNSIIRNCYATGHVNGTNYVGGLVGYDSDGIYTKSFWNTIVNATLTGIGNTSDPNVIGASTTNLQTESTYVDSVWDFVGETFNGIEDIWFIPQWDYPHLWWEGMQVPMKLTPVSLNCRSEGNWVKAHITMPQGFTVADVNSKRSAVLHSFGFQSLPLYVFGEIVFILKLI
jgi:hypothetical protein